MAVTALYVHVPFCAQKCRYCDFDSRSFAPCNMSVALDTYFEQLYARLDAFGDAGALAQIRTVYVGGGTPSLAGERLVEFARRISAWCKPVEFTCEANPESLTAELATALAGVGVTRVKRSITPNLPPSAAFTMPIGRSLPSRRSRTLGLSCRAT